MFGISRNSGIIRYVVFGDTYFIVSCTYADWFMHQITLINKTASQLAVAVERWSITMILLVSSVTTFSLASQLLQFLVRDSSSTSSGLKDADLYFIQFRP